MLERLDIHLLQLDEEEDAGVLQHGPEHEHDAGDHPALDGGEPVRLKRNKWVCENVKCSFLAQRIIFSFLIN